MSDDKVLILFVDDEANLLQGLKRMLRGMRNQWDMHFANSGAEALALLTTQKFDVVVSDMRMPEMDGSEFLSQVSTIYPSIIRIILSGYAKNEAILRTVRPSHQYLAKPCNPEVLTQIVQKALDLRDLLDEPDLREFVAGIKKIPSPSPTYHALVSELQSPTATTASVSEIISKDIGLTAQTLKLTNSAYFGLPTKITNCDDAIRLLGFDTITSLVSVANFYGAFDGSAAQLELIETLGDRSLKIGMLAKNIALSIGLKTQDVDTAFSAGLLAHIGTLVLITNFPDQAEQAFALADEKNLSITEAEKQIFGASHAELGAYLLGLWGFNHEIIGAVAHHHAPDANTSEPLSVSSIIHIAQFITRISDDNAAARKIRFADVQESPYLSTIRDTDQFSEWVSIYQSITPKGA